MVREMLTVESNNLSFNDNKLASFRVRLPRELNLELEHTLALVDISIPNTIFNITTNNYFTLSLVRRSKKARAEKRVSPEPEPDADSFTLPWVKRYKRDALIIQPLPYESVGGVGPAEVEFSMGAPDIAPKPGPLPDPACETSELSQPKDFALDLKVLIPKGFYIDIQKVLMTLEAALLRVVGKPEL